MINRRLAIVAVIVLFVCLSPLAAVEQTASGGFDIVQHDLRLQPDFDTHRITGVQRITFKSTRDGTSRITFSDNALTITRATFGVRPLNVSRQDGQIAVDLLQPLQRGQEITISVFYEGQPRRGLVFGRQAIYTSYFACDWMFCQQDRTSDKARFNLTLRLPKGMTSVAVGLRTAIAPAGTGLEDHPWFADREYSSYLFGFVAGSFQRASTRVGNTDLVYLSEGEPAESLQRLFASTAEMINFFEERAGVRLLLRQYTQLLVPGSAAQEVAQFSILGADVVKPILDNPQEDWAIAHELAHQWWGNRVTCETWTEMWLNEGITTFMVAAWKEHKWGRAAYEREMTLLEQRYDAAVKAGFDVALTFTGDYPSLAIKRAIVYSKGALFMDRLRREMGDDRFWQALRAFTRTYVGRTVTSHDFQRSFESVNGRDLAVLFDRWVY